MKKIKLTLIFTTIFLITSCNNRYHKMIKELQEMPAPDYSYVIQPEYSQEKESIEFELKELFAAEEVEIDIFTNHSYDTNTKEHIEGEFWPRIAILNSKSFNGYREENLANTKARKIAEFVLSKISNKSDYQKIEIVFVRSWNDGNQKLEKRSVYLKIPNLEITDFANAT